MLGGDTDPAAAGAVQAGPADQQVRAARGCTPASTARAKFAAWGERLWKRPVAWGLASLVVLLALAAPVHRPEDRDALDQGAARATPRARVGYDQVQRAFGDGAPGTLQIVVDRRRRQRAAAAVLAATPASPARCPPMPATDGSGLRR